MNTPHALTALKKLMTPLLVVSLLLLSACSSGPVRRAPVENRAESALPPSSQNQVPQVKAPSGPYAANAGQAGYYTVKPGDTLLQIGRNTGQNARDIAQWNGISNPNQIEVGQVLRVAPPGMNTPSSGSAGVISTPVTSGGSTVSTNPVPAPSLAPAGASTTPTVVPPATPVAPAAKPADSVDFIWPTNGALISGYDEVKSKGLKFAGRAGDPVIAAADGRVVYAGAGLRGYGNLVILKHNETYLTAYAHNQTLLVKEEQVVRKGQRIADMGNSDADRVMLHFEIRRNGKPVDPAKYLMPR
ncbi:MAG TPA: peptidoglycan DD-metalloendopeptidase family protein [Burkholderiaceae bacterium]|nr:peptidoglycan DD-metalloendopeptidase family protein [Burkholderiaceae bacterium]